MHYATIYWTEHTRVAELYGIASDDVLDLFRLQERDVAHIWSNFEPSDMDPGPYEQLKSSWSLLHVVANEGLIGIL